MKSICPGGLHPVRARGVGTGRSDLSASFLPVLAAGYTSRPLSYTQLCREQGPLLFSFCLAVSVLDPKIL